MPPRRIQVIARPLNFISLVALIVALFPSPLLATSRVALLIDAAAGVDPIPTAFDRFLPNDLAPADLLELDLLAADLVGGASLVQELREKAEFAAADFRYQRHGVQGRLRFLTDPDPFLAFDLTVTNTADRTLNLFLLLNISIDPLSPNVRVASQLSAVVTDDDLSGSALLTDQQSIMLGFADDSFLATPIRLTTAATPTRSRLEVIPSTTIPTNRDVTALLLQHNLSLTPGDTAHLTGHLAAGNNRTPILNTADIQLLLNRATIPEPATAPLLLLCFTFRKWGGYRARPRYVS